jgi:hypothetical protein
MSLFCVPAKYINICIHVAKTVFHADVLTWKQLDHQEYRMDYKQHQYIQYVAFETSANTAC